MIARAVRSVAGLRNRQLGDEQLDLRDRQAASPCYADRHNDYRACSHGDEDTLSC